PELIRGGGGGRRRGLDRIRAIAAEFAADKIGNFSYENGGHDVPLLHAAATGSATISASDGSGGVTPTGAGSIEMMANRRVSSSSVSVTISPILWPSKTWPIAV